MIISEYKVIMVDGLTVTTTATSPDQAKRQVLDTVAPFAPDSAVKSVENMRVLHDGNI